ncbi:Rv3235 family protein [Nocardia arizonensis]|uniref:Rv3235 family protein n=1 Tax=Nocardia arizonensis TaxID=1141647 RepID=UPI0012E0DCEB|nr:Rv3235 family protein [Nocardia arizonensis]
MCRTDVRAQTASRGRAPTRRIRCGGGGSAARVEPVVDGGVLGSAREFAERALRVVLEVLDHRRPAAQLAAFTDPRVVAAVRTVVTSGAAPGQQLGTATLGRVTVVPVDGRTVEICAGYDRGARHFALAGRIVRVESGGWRLAALRVR